MGRNAVVGIPWRPAPGRLEAFTLTRGWYESNGFEVVTADVRPNDSPHFNLAACRNRLVEDLATMDGDVVILSDADTRPELEPLEAAIEYAREFDTAVLPYHLYRRVRSNGDVEFVPGARSGVYVTTRNGWFATGGQDERFQGWGFEDAAWELAFTTLVGPIPRFPGFVTALDHERSQQARDRRGPTLDNSLLHRQYLRAYGDVAAMRELLQLETS